jgi:carotenoid cleavage dioxygenase-like enzyme
MDNLHGKFYRVTPETIHEGTTVRYHWRDGTGLATVTEKTDDRIAFRGPECNGRFTHDQIERLVQDGRLEVVLDDERHDGE